MDVIFFGTPAFALPILKALRRQHRILAVATRPDKPKGRHLKPVPSTVKSWAVAQSIPVVEPESLRDPAFAAWLTVLSADAAVVAAYGKIIPAALLNIPKYGFLNVHGSLLPRYRGAAPIQRALMAGEEKTGVTIMQMDEGMDTGPILKQAEVPIGPDDDAGSLGAKMAEAGARAMIEVLGDLPAGAIKPTAQNDKMATYAPPIKREETEIDWSRTAREVCNLIRALSPSPGAHTHWRKRRLKIRRALATPAASLTGRLVVTKDILMAGTRQGTVDILELQPEGKKTMKAEEFIRGYRPSTGDEVGGKC